MARSPARVFLVGDSVTDVETARRAGMRSIVITWGNRDRQELPAAQPDHMADNPAEVGRIVEALIRDAS